MEPVNGLPAVQLEELTKDYGTLRAVDHLSLTVKPGEVYGLLGPNGAGKTTTLRVLLGFLHPTGGRARVFGTEIRQNPVAVREAIGYLPGDVHLDPKPTGEETLAFLGRLHPGFDPAYRRQLVERFAFDPSRPVREYSKGNRQKLGLIAALQHRPRLALLDEPTSGLDPLMQREFYAVLSELTEAGSAVVFSSHVLTEVQQVCERVGVLRKGKLVFENTVSELARETVRRVEVVFAGPVPREEELALPGIVKVERRGDRYRIFLAGNPDAVVKALAQYELEDVVFEHPDLEDLFMKFYGEP